jgi:hypothetical protein
MTDSGGGEKGNTPEEIVNNEQMEQPVTAAEMDDEDEKLLKTLLGETDVEVTTEQVNKIKNVIAESRQGKNGLGGAKDMFNLTISVGIQVPRILFADLINACSMNDTRKSYYAMKLSKIMIKETGSIGFKYINASTKEEKTGYIVYERCDDDHHIQTEIDNYLDITSSTPESREKNNLVIISQIKKIFGIGHSIYCHMIEACSGVFDSVQEFFPSGFDLEEIKYNAEKAEFYLDIPNSSRVGIFIRL